MDFDYIINVKRWDQYKNLHVINHEKLLLWIRIVNVDFIFKFCASTLT